MKELRDLKGLTIHANHERAHFNDHNVPTIQPGVFLGGGGARFGELGTKIPRLSTGKLR